MRNDYGKLAQGVMGAVRQAQQIQNEFLAQRLPTHTWAQVRALPQGEKDALQTQYTAWLDARTSRVIAAVREALA